VTNIVLSVEAMTKRFGACVAVDQLTLSVREGEVLGLLGPNGAGKTTSISMLCGLLAPDSGRVLFRGAPFGRGHDARTRVGLCPQDIVLWDQSTCIEQLRFMGRMYDLGPSEARRRGDHLLAVFGLEPHRDKLARALSGGMRRRLNLAMALVHDPAVVILDEPEAGLDPQSRVLVREYLRELSRTKTLILTTHDMDEAARLADRVAIIDHGRLLVVDTPEALTRGIGEGDVIEMRLAADRDEARALTVLRELPGGTSALARSGVVIVRTRDGVRALQQFAHVLEAAGIVVADLRLRQATLEDVFITLTGRRLRE